MTTVPGNRDNAHPRRPARCEPGWPAGCRGAQPGTRPATVVNAGDQIPAVREGVPAVAVNTVLRAHRDPERRGRVSALAGPDGAGQSALLRILARQASPAGRMACVQDGTPRQDPDGAGLDEDRITALCTGALRDFHWRRGGLADHAGAAGSETEGVA